MFTEPQDVLQAGGGKVGAFFTFSSVAVRKTNVLAVGEASLMRGGSCGTCEWATASLLSSASLRSPS